MTKAFVSFDLGPRLSLDSVGDKGKSQGRVGATALRDFAVR